jgi:hypothetical protein
LGALAADVVAAVLTAGVIAIFTIPLDLAMVASATTGQPVFAELRTALGQIAQDPTHLAPGVWNWAAFASTYAVANMSERRHLPVLLVVLLTTTLDMGCSMLRDALVAERSIFDAPGLTVLFWFLRDAVSTAGSFVLPPLLVPLLSRLAGSQSKGEYASQFAVPILLQYVATPLHFLGLNVMVKTGSFSWPERIASALEGYLSRVGARQLKLAPPFSIGVSMNRILRNHLYGLWASHSHKEKSN